jgi:hypothetical protein
VPNVTFRPNRRNIASLLQTPQVRADLARRAKNIANAAGPGKWNVHDEKGRNRARAVVVTGDIQARRNEARTRALTRAIDAGRR